VTPVSADCSRAGVRRGQLEALDQEPLGLLRADLGRLLDVRVHQVGQPPGVDGVLVDRVKLGHHPAQHGAQHVSERPRDPVRLEQLLSQRGLTHPRRPTDDVEHAASHGGSVPFNPGEDDGSSLEPPPRFHPPTSRRRSGRPAAHATNGYPTRRTSLHEHRRTRAHSGCARSIMVRMRQLAGAVGLVWPWSTAAAPGDGEVRRRRRRRRAVAAVR
jgi:hypothetical protein